MESAAAVAILWRDPGPVVLGKRVHISSHDRRVVDESATISPHYLAAFGDTLPREGIGLLGVMFCYVI